MEKIEIVEQFKLVNETWLEAIKKKYGHFGEKNFVDNLCNEIFFHYNGLFNVLVFRIPIDDTLIHIELTSSPLQYLTLTVGEVNHYGIYIFKEGFFRIPLSFEPWCAYGSYIRTAKSDWWELNFYYTNKD